MKRYLEHMQQKSAHERRRHAMQVAGVLTAIVFAGWVSTLGMGLSSQSATVAGSDNNTQSAATLLGATTYGQNQLEVATTTY